MQVAGTPLLRHVSPGRPSPFRSSACDDHDAASTSPRMTNVKTMTPAELAERLARADDLLLLDVREPHELDICRIEGSLAMPMSEISARLSELDPDKPTVCICHHGIRSAHVAS